MGLMGIVPAGTVANVSWWLPPLVAFAISFFTAMGGVSGAFLLLPFQVSVLGFTSPAVSSTNQLYNVVAIPGGVWRYIREGRMVWALAWVIVIGTLPGVLAGSYIRVRYLPDPGTFKVFAGLVLLYIGGRMAWDLLAGGGMSRKARAAEDGFLSRARARRDGGGGEARPDLPCIRVRRFGLLSTAYEFNGEVFDFSTPGVLTLSLLAGVVAGTYGIGGGAIMAPFLVSVFGLPVYTVAGPALLGTFVASGASVVFYQAMAPLFPGLAVSPDWHLGALFGLGGLAGIYCGARLQKYVPARAIKWLLCLVALLLAVKYLGVLPHSGG